MYLDTYLADTQYNTPILCQLLCTCGRPDLSNSPFNNRDEPYQVHHLFSKNSTYQRIFVYFKIIKVNMVDPRWSARGLPSRCHHWPAQGLAPTLTKRRHVNYENLSHPTLSWFSIAVSRTLTKRRHIPINYENLSHPTLSWFSIAVSPKVLPP